MPDGISWHVINMQLTFSWYLLPPLSTIDLSAIVCTSTLRAAKSQCSMFSDCNRRTFKKGNHEKTTTTTTRVPKKHRLQPTRQQHTTLKQRQQCHNKKRNAITLIHVNGSFLLQYHWPLLIWVALWTQQRDPLRSPEDCHQRGTLSEYKLDFRAYCKLLKLVPRLRVAIKGRWKKERRGEEMWVTEGTKANKWQ